MAVETSKPYNEQDDTSHYGPYKITFLTYPAHSKNSVDLVRSYKSDSFHNLTNLTNLTHSKNIPDIVRSYKSPTDSYLHLQIHPN